MTFIKPQPFKLSENRYLFTDIFIQQMGIIGITGMIYSDFPINHNNIIIIYNGTRYKPNIKNIAGIKESSVNLLFDYEEIKKTTESSIKVECIYNGMRKNYTLVKTNNAYKKLSMFTLFLHENFLIKTWIEYYLKRGVDHFYIYFNGAVNNNVISELNDFINKGVVTLCEWNFAYWIWYPKKFIGVKGKLKDHHAQPMAINNCLYKYRNESEWIANFDTDEFIQCNSLKLLLSKYSNKTALIFNNIWARLEGYNWGERINLHTLESSKLYASMNAIYGLGKRTKIIFNTNKVRLMFIHYVREPRHAGINVGFFYHITNMTKNRGGKVVNPVITNMLSNRFNTVHYPPSITQSSNIKTQQQGGGKKIQKGIVKKSHKKIRKIKGNKRYGKRQTNKLYRTLKPRQKNGKKMVRKKK